MYYYQFNIGDYTRDTQHLDLMEDIAYRRMLDLYYQREMPLPKEVKEIARLIRMREHCECIAIVLDEFWTLTERGYTNNGADKVLGKAYSKSESARLAAKARWNKNKDLDNADALQTHNESNADGMPPNTQDPLHNTHNTKPKTKRFAPPSIEEVFEHLSEKGYPYKQEAEKFWHYYESNGWKVGKNKMKNWKSSATGWIQRANLPKQKPQQQFTMPENHDPLEELRKL